MYAVFSLNLEKFTPDSRFLHRHRRWCQWQIWGMPGESLEKETRQDSCDFLWQVCYGFWRWQSIEPPHESEDGLQDSSESLKVVFAIWCFFCFVGHFLFNNFIQEVTITSDLFLPIGFPALLVIYEAFLTNLSA